MSVSGSAAGTTNPPPSQLLWVWTRMWGDVIQNSRVKSPSHLRFFISSMRHICNYSFARSELATYPANLCSLDAERFLKSVKYASQLCFLWLYVKCCVCEAGLDAVKFWKQDSLKHRRHQPGNHPQGNMCDPCCQTTKLNAQPMKSQSVIVIKYLSWYSAFSCVTLNVLMLHRRVWNRPFVIDSFAVSTKQTTCSLKQASALSWIHGAALRPKSWSPAETPEKLMAARPSIFLVAFKGRCKMATEDI